MRPLIAVTTTSHTAPELRVPQVMLGIPYLDAIERRGATGLLLTPAHRAEAIEQLLDHSHALMLTGGEDIDPSRYGQEPHSALETPNPERDAMEFAALAGALERRMPVLAICRGCQLLNVALGGTLYQDLPSQRGGALLHEQQAALSERWHSARVEPGSDLHEVFGVPELFINSFHHQGIDELAPQVRATVWAEDGLVEGIEARSYPWVFGVQWHPERGEAETPGADPRDPDRRLFVAFVDAARAYAAEAQASTWK